MVKYCITNISQDPSSCLIVNTISKIDLILITVAPLSEYREGSDEEKRCRRALCLCDLEMVRCMGLNKDEIDITRVSHQQCNITGKTKFQDEMFCIVIHTHYIVFHFLVNFSSLYCVIVRVGVVLKRSVVGD